MTFTSKRPGAADGPHPSPVPAATVRDVLSAVPDATLVARADSADGVTLRDVTHDSRGAGPAVLFACRPGARADGHDFAPAAVAAGSPALLVERALDLDVPQVRVGSVARAIGPIAAAVHGHPSDRMVLCGITGTNGKTTTAYLTESVLRSAGHTTGLVGTVQTVVAGEAVPGIRTTPEAGDLQRLLHRMVDAGVTAAAMEVSSHGLALGRVAGTRFDVAVFTNLSQDHLDFHRDLDDYFEAKARLFDPVFVPRAVINVDDPYGRRLAEIAAERGLDVIRLARSGEHAATVTASQVETGPAGSTFTAHLGSGRLAVRTALPGPFNVTNALAALAAAEAVGIDPQVAARGIAALAGVPGRMERVDAGQPFTVLVDYAHTPDSLEHVLRAARSLIAADRRVHVVVGCGGDRDHGKRPLMGAAAAALADVAVFTNDNPRSEDPMAILRAVGEGAATVAGARFRIEPDRRRAIGAALADAAPGDIVVIAGKGHETYQELADRTVDFDDREVARALLTGGAR